MPTYHSLIKIANPGNEPTQVVIDQIEQLISYSHFGPIDNQELVYKMKEIVSEFISKNSPFEALDLQVA